MRISDILRGKGEQVVTVTPDTNVETAPGRARRAQDRCRRGVREGSTVEGIVSERDVVRALARARRVGAGEPVTAIHTADVHTIAPDAAHRRRGAADDRAAVSGTCRWWPTAGCAASSASATW
jgi:CBS domain-containing protein